jgi:hypothetical protein
LRGDFVEPVEDRQDPALFHQRGGRVGTVETDAA